MFFGPKNGSLGSNDSYGKLIKDAVKGRRPVITVSNVMSADDALNHGDTLLLVVQL